MPYWICHYHLIWSTFGREPTILPTSEPILFDAIKNETEGQKAILLAVNGVADHIHVAVSMPPALSVATLVGRLKGASSHALNASHGSDKAVFRWQEGYGVLTFGDKSLEQVVNYVRHQKEHHANHALYSSFERIE